MKKLTTFFLVSLLFSTSAWSQTSVQEIFSDSIKTVMKNDFKQQELVKISFEVNRRLLAFTGYKPKLAQLEKDRPKIRTLIANIGPWAIMENLKPEEVARIIIYMYHADQAGASFLDSEDLVPLVAKLDIPIKDFVVMVQYNRETKQANIAEEVRQLFLNEAIRRRWDGASILAGGRGLMLAKNMGLDVNKSADLFLKIIPPNGKSYSPDTLMNIIKKAINYTTDQEQVSGGAEIIANYSDVHQIIRSPQATTQNLQQVIEKTKEIDSQTKAIATAKDEKKTVGAIQNQQGIIKDYDKVITTPKDWRVVSRNALKDAIKPWLGTRYKWGGKTGPPHGPGVDCSGFTRLILMDKRIGVPRVPHGGEQKTLGSSVSLSLLDAGDLVFFSASPAKGKITHVALITSPTDFAHSCNSGVIYTKLNNRYWAQRMVIARRVFTKRVN